MNEPRKAGRDRHRPDAGNAPAIAPMPDGFAAAHVVAANVGDEARVPLLRTIAEVDEYLDAHARGNDAFAIERLLVDAPTWQRHIGAAFDGASTFRTASRLGLALVDPEFLEPDPAALALLTPATARRYRIVPLRTGRSLLVVMTDGVFDADTLHTLEFLSERRILPVLATPVALQLAISRCYDRAEDAALLSALGLRDDGEDDGEDRAHDNERLAKEQPIVRLVQDAIAEAVRRRASDIHIRPREDDFEMLLRIDGMLIPVRVFAKPLLRAVVSRIKVLGNINIAEHRLPQDGRATFSAANASIDLRISILPTVFGESVVIRLLDTRQSLRSLAEIGFGEEDERRFRMLTGRSHGMILVTGPTGSGKSTTLYAVLLEARKRNVNIISVEDPVEYHIGDALQIQVNQAIGLGFGRTLRNILRHDPDVVMLGEIRDRETAEISVEAALTGHLLLSTLHTNTAATTVTRLLDLGVESFLLRSTLLAVLAQRLARRNCAHCAVDEDVDPEVRGALGVGAEETFRRGAGCQHCDGTGVRGRIAVYELMPVSAAIRRLIVPNADGDAIHAAAVSEGMQPITAHAIALARAGTISLAEAYRIRVE